MSEASKARIAVLGAGWWGVEVYIPAVMDNPDAELVAVNRRNRTALDSILAAFEGPRGYTDYRELIASEELDAAVVVSPHVVHYEQARAALDAGLHVLIDKPMTTNAGHARTLVKLASDRGRQIIIPYGWNFKDYATEASELIAAGRIGTIRHVTCQMATYTFDLFNGQGLSETADHMFRPNRSTWADPERAGGYGWGQLTHALGLLFRLVDIDPSEVYAIKANSATGVDLIDTAIVKLANGAAVSLSGCALVPKHCSYQLDIRVFGTDGMLLIDMERARMELRRFDKDDVILDLEPDEGAYAAVEPVRRLVEICNGSATRNEAPARVGLRAVEVLDAMYRSFDSGRSEPV